MLPAPFAKAVYWSLQPCRGRGDILKRFHMLQESQWLSYNKMQEFSFRKLEKLIIHAYETVPYYTDVMKLHGFNPKKFQSFDDLKKLPILTRQDLEKNFERLKSSKIAEYEAYESCSSGSTGQPARFMQDKNYDMWCRAHQLRAYGWCGDWEIGKKFALVWGSPVYWDKQTIVRKAEAAITNRIELNCNDVGNKNLLRIARRLAEYNPILISGYSTALYLMTDIAKAHNIKIEGLKALQPNAEPTYDYMAQSMRDYFKVPIFDKYGSTETNIIAHQSTHHNDLMCRQAENTHVEFLNDDDNYCDDHEDGRLIVTTLNNYSMPLIRYQTSDIAAPIGGTCPSGRGFPLMSKVRGRLHDLIQTPEGSTVHPQLFSNLFSNFISVQWFQVVQNEPDTLDISLMVREKADKDLEDTFLKMINLRTNSRFQARFSYMEKMPETKTGKHKLCVCNLKKP